MNTHRKKYISSFDGENIFVRIWDNVEKKKGVVLLVHGMCEHSKRYDDFAGFLNKNGYIVWGFDLRAHGQTSQNIASLGKYEKDLFADSVNDIIFFSNYLHEKYNLPLFVFGHSFGSFLLQRYIELYDNYRGVVICGSANMKGQASVSLGKFVAKTTNIFCGKCAKAKFIAKLSFGAYEKHFEDKNWLTRDRKVFDDYQKDEYCGFVCSSNFYYSFFKNLKKIYKSENLAQINKASNIFVISGRDDPVGNFSKLVLKLTKLYDKLGLKHLKYKIYESARHELLNETNKQEVYQDILNFFEDLNKKTYKAKKNSKKEWNLFDLYIKFC